MLHQRVADGMLVIETRNLTYIELDAVGADMWEALSEASDFDAAVDRVMSLYDADAKTIRGDLVRMTNKWVELGLGALVDGSPAPTGDDRDVNMAVPVPEPADLYLDLMVKVLCGLTSGGIEHLGARLMGKDTPLGDPSVYTLVGAVRLQNVRALIQRALDENVPGDFMECGVWRGGATILMRAVLAARQVTDRTVWVADSFAGLPEVGADGHPSDHEEWARFNGLFAAAEDDVRANFEKFGLLDDQVRFLPGWFEDSLPVAEVEQLAVLRLDADLYDSTMTALTHLYPKVSPGGYLIIDDYDRSSCRLAVHDFLETQGHHTAFQPIDWNAVWWQKPLL